MSLDQKGSLLPSRRRNVALHEKLVKAAAKRLGELNSEKVCIVLLLVVLTGVYFLQIDVPGLVDYDEAVYAEVARGMHASGDLLEPRYNGRPFFEKPPLVYWLEVAGFHLLGVNETGVRFFNVLAALGTLFSVYLFTRRAIGARVARLACLVLSSSFGFVIVARLALTDMLLTLFLFLSLACLHRAYEHGLAGKGGTGWFLGGAVFAGFAMLSKGLIGILLPAGAAFFYLLSLRRLGLFFRLAWLVPGLLIAFLVGGFWYPLLGLTHDEGFGFLRVLFVEHHLGRFTNPMQGHSGPFFYYVLVLALGFLPWTGFLLPAAVRGGRHRVQNEGRRYLRLLGAFAVLTVLFFSVATTKLPNYVMPVYPFLAIWVACTLAGRPEEDAPKGGSWRLAAVGTISVPFLGAMLFAALPFAFELATEDVPVRILCEAPGLSQPIDLKAAPIVMAGFALFLGLAMAWLWRRRRLTALTWTVGVGSLLLCMLLVVLLLPRIDAHFFEPLRRVARQAAVEEKNGPIAMVGLRHRASVLFYGRRTTRYVSGDHDDDLATLFSGPDPVSAITIDPYLERIRAHGRIEEVLRDTGYILLRCHPRPR